MTRPAYRLADQFIVRLTGVPFDVTESLATPALAAIAREILELEERARRCGDEALAALDRLPAERRRRLPRIKSAVRRQVAIGAAGPDAPPELAAYDAAVAALARARERLAAELPDQVARSIAAVVDAALRTLPDFAVIESDALLDELDRLAAGAADRPAKMRARARHLAMYLQRVCSKNETVSAFGPFGWGRVVPGLSGLSLRARPGIARRKAAVERWVVRAIAQAMNADPEARGEAAPRLYPAGRLEGDRFVRLDTGAEIPLSPRDRELLARCDGRTPARELGAATELDALAEAGALIWKLELVAMDPAPLATLRDDVSRWADGPARRRWSAALDRLAELERRFTGDLRPASRRAVLAQVRAEVAAAGGDVPTRTRLLYAASNPIAEDCARDVTFHLGEDVVDQLLDDAAPWLDLYRDAYCLGASRCYHRLRELYAGAPRRGGVTSLPAFMAHCAANGVRLEGAGLAEIVAGAYADIRQAMRDALAGRPDAAEWTLTGEECRAIRERYRFHMFDGFSWPSADLQLAASSPEAVSRGDYQWVVSELHHTVAPLQSFDWACPDPARFREQVAIAGGGEGLLAHTVAAFEAPVSLSVISTMEIFPQSAFVAVQRPRPEWTVIPPAEAEVVVDDEHEDIRARQIGTGRDLGSLVRAPRLFMGMHPFVPVHLGRHTPRLRRGRTVLQRRMWTIARAELEIGKLDGLSPELVLAWERLRARRGLPRWLFARPSAGALRSTASFGRDKDLKPFCADLESYLFLEILARRLDTYGELELSEMLPAPEQLVWREPDGRRCFELRAVVLPRR